MKPFPYQLEGIKTVAPKLRFLLRDEPGLGKTCQLICATRAIGAKKVLVICPISMCISWKREIVLWGGNLDNFTIINHDKLPIENHLKPLLQDYDVVIADESHQFLKNASTQRARAFLKIIKRAKHVWLATATVGSRSGEDYYCTLKILLPDIFKDWTKKAFRERYCKPVEQVFYSKSPVRGCKCVKLPAGQYQCTRITYEGFNNLEELHKLFSVCSLKRTAEEVKLQLPELTETDIYLPNSNIVFDPDELLDIRKSIEKGEDVKADYQARFKQAGLNNIPYAIEFLNSYPTNTNAVLYGWHKEVIHELVAEIKLKCPDRSTDFINGEVIGAVRRQGIIDSFQAKDINTLALNVQSGGAGITLTAATKGIYLQPPQSVIHWVQSRKRVHRIGSEEPVQIIKLISKGSIDEDIFKVLNERASFIKEVEG